MKRLIIVVMALLMIAAVFAGCATDNRDRPTNTIRPTATINPDYNWDDYQNAPTVAPGGGVPDRSPVMTPGVSPSPMMDPNL